MISEPILRRRTRTIKVEFVVRLNCPNDIGIPLHLHYVLCRNFHFPVTTLRLWWAVEFYYKRQQWKPVWSELLGNFWNQRTNLQCLITVNCTSSRCYIVEIYRTRTETPKVFLLPKLLCLHVELKKRRFYFLKFFKESIFFRRENILYKNTTFGINSFFFFWLFQ